MSVKAQYRYIYSFVILLVLLFFSTKSIAAFRYLQEGMPAPILNGVDLVTGQKISTEDWKDDGTTIIVFWATWSKRSIDELSDMAELAVKYQDKPVHFIAVNVEGKTITKQLKEKIAREMAGLNISFASIIDAEMEFFNKFGHFIHIRNNDRQACHDIFKQFIWHAVIVTQARIFDDRYTNIR